MNLYVGTSGYSYKEWKGTFYPADMSAKGMLHYYGERFRTVEINNTCVVSSYGGLIWSNGDFRF